jgi:tetratricopeptide (TPR) repeat protein
MRWLLMLLLGIALLNADRIILKNGNEFQGRILKKSGNTLELEVAFGRITLQVHEIKEIIKEEDSTVLLKEGLEYLQYQSYPQAIRSFVKALKINPQAEEVLQHFRKASQTYGDLLLEAGNYEEAEQFFKELQEHYPEESFAPTYLGKIKIAKSQLQEVLEKARQESTKGQWKKAVQLYQKLLKNAPGSAEVYGKEMAYAYANLASQLNRETEAQQISDLLEKALTLHPKIAHYIEGFYLETQILLVTQDLQNKRLSEAQQRIKSALDFSPASLVLRLYLGYTYESLGDENKAREEYSRILPEKNHRTIALIDLRELALNKLRGIATIQETEESWNIVENENFQQIETPHFVIHYYNKKIADEVATAAEYYLQKTFNQFPKKPCLSLRSNVKSISTEIEKNIWPI